MLLLALCHVNVHANSRSLLHYDHGVAAVHLWCGSSVCQSHKEDDCGLETVVKLGKDREKIVLSLEPSIPEVSGLSMPIWLCYQFKETEQLCFCLASISQWAVNEMIRLGAALVLHSYGATHNHVYFFLLEVKNVFYQALRFGIVMENRCRSWCIQTY